MEELNFSLYKIFLPFCELETRHCRPPGWIPEGKKEEKEMSF